MDVVDKIENQAPKQKPSPAEAQEKERQKRKTEELRKIEEQKILAYIKTIEDTQKRVDEHRTNEAKRLVEEGINLGENGFETLMNYLEILRDRSREELTEKNTAAWITAIQVALNIVSDFQRIDGVLGNTTKTCIKDFQKKHGLRVDGLPGRETIDKFITEARRIQKEKEENEKRTIEQRNTITAKSSISLEEAKFLRAHYKIILPHGLGESEGINLNITSITKEIAAELASCPLRSLRLNKVTSISEEVATELAKHNWQLDLNGLTSISTAAAAALSKHNPSFGDDGLALNGLTSISKEVAIEFSKYTSKTHRRLELNGLKNVSKTIADILDTNKSIEYKKS